MIKRIAIGVASVAIAFSFTACGGGTAAAPEDVNGTLEGAYEVGYINVDGERLRCVTMKRGGLDSGWGGLWCFPPKQPVTP